MRPRHEPFRFGWVLIALLLIACGEEKAPPAPQEPPPDLNEQTQKGWDLFRSHDYPASASTFRGLIEAFPSAPDPYVGLGWCQVEMDSLPQALVLFSQALRFEEQPDAVAGLAVVASALGRDSLAVDAASRLSDSGYIFVGNPAFGYRQVIYLLALGQYHLLRYQECYASLRILDPNLDVDLDAWDFREQILAALEALRNLP
jgi:hypothetical protein